MTVNTLIVWHRLLTEDETTAMQARIAEDVAAGKTNGSWEGVGYEGSWAAQRSWTDQASADSWINFVSTFTPAPKLAITQVV